MEGADFVAFCALMTAIVIIAFIVGDLQKRKLRFKERELELLAGQTAEKAAQYVAHSERIEARVRVLERIATDKGTDLAAAIEDLRDPSVN